MDKLGRRSFNQFCAALIGWIRMPIGDTVDDLDEDEDSEFSSYSSISTSSSGAPRVLPEPTEPLPLAEFAWGDAESYGYTSRIGMKR